MLRSRPRGIAGLALAVPLVLGSASCCRRPPASVVEVNLALGRAKDACAAVYAPQELQEVERRVEAMNRLADDGKCRTAGSAAGPMKPDVDAFSSLVESRKDRARSEARLALEDAETAMGRARGAARGGAPPAALDGAERTLAIARRMGEDPCAYLRAAALAREAAAAAALAGGAGAAGEAARH